MAPVKQAFINVACSQAEKLRWWRMADALGFRSLSAMVRHAITQLEEKHGRPSSHEEAQ